MDLWRLVVAKEIRVVEHCEADIYDFLRGITAGQLFRPATWKEQTEAGTLDPMDETFREYERVVDKKYLEQIRAQAKQFFTKLLSRKARLAECAIRNFKKGKNTIRPRSLRKLTMAIHDLQNKNMQN